MKHPGAGNFLFIASDGTVSHGWIVAESVGWQISYSREHQKDWAVFLDGHLIQQGTKFSIKELEDIKNEQKQKWGY